MKREFLKNYFLQAEARMKQFHHDNGEMNDEGFDDEGYDDEGYDDEGYDDEGFDDEGFDDEGFDDEGYNNDMGRRHKKHKHHKMGKKGVAAVATTSVVAGGGGAAAVAARMKKNRHPHHHAKHQRAMHNNLPISKSYQLQITNATGGQATINLFNSSANRTALNFGNPAGVTITYLRPNFEYVQLLTQTEKMDLKIGLIRVDCSNTAQLNTPIQWQRITSDGAIVGDTIDNFQNIYQNLTTSVQAPADFKLTGDTAILYPMLNGVSVNMYLFPSHLVNLGNLLKGGNALVGFTDPYLGGIQKIKLMGA